MHLRAEVIQTGKNTTGIRVPTEQVEALRKGKRAPVQVTINGYTFRSTMTPMGGKNWIPVSAGVRDRARVAGGDVIDIDVELDTAPRVVQVPPDLAEALTRVGPARTFFEGLSYSNRCRHYLTIEGTKTHETRQHRVARAVALFHDGKS